MALIEVCGDMSKSDIARMFAGRQYDSTFPHNFSDHTPHDVETCMQRVEHGAWRPFAVLLLGRVMQWHYLHDMQPEHRSTWGSTYLIEGEHGPRGYGMASYYLKKALAAAAEEFVRQNLGYAHVFASCLATNTPSKSWLTKCGGFSLAGTLLHAAPMDGELVDVEVYTLAPEGRKLCREQAESLFPDGIWTNDASVSDTKSHL